MLTVSNTVTFSSGAIFRVELWATNNDDRLVILLRHRRRD